MVDGDYLSPERRYVSYCQATDLGSGSSTSADIWRYCCLSEPWQLASRRQAAGTLLRVRRATSWMARESERRAALTVERQRRRLDLADAVTPTLSGEN